MKKNIFVLNSVPGILITGKYLIIKK